MDDVKKYWWSLTQHRVVTAEECRAEGRLGPYATPAEAQNALSVMSSGNTISVS